MRSISLALLLAVARVAAAEPCEHTGLAITMFDSRSTLATAPDAGLGLDVWAHGPSITWGRCHGLRHRIESVAFEAPDYGDPDSRFLHFARYQLQWHDDTWSAYAGVRAVTVWAGEVRFATPVAGLRTWPSSDLAISFELASAGVFVAAIEGGTRRRLRGDLALEAKAAWPATSATRAELRARVRDYRIDDMRTIRDVTATAGVGLALAARPGVRGMPGFLGVAVRRDRATEILLVAELALAVTDN